MKYYTAVGYLLLTSSLCHAFTTPKVKSSTNPTIHKSNSLFPTPKYSSRLQQPASSNVLLPATATAVSPPSSDDESGGGFLSFKTKYGYLNPFAIYYGLTAILLGLPWFVALNICQLIYAVSRNKLDKFKRLPTTVSHIWGVLLLILTRSYPEIVNKEKLDNFFKE